ncbi:PTS sugar transporter subunit IIB [Lactobacillus sp. YT155]|uniref:PTS sugar transporter subunit IIB n=1 Tax=Lactobacillus sp. YT155 TaxID=3060955 RepID=UPI00265D83DB|nr:PTS sugar transporter subunit IIB [Lactobacillus sp. YT155]MDO1605629.1 PTS sugar transporter subunit IIB [Lactobacillus sp. YT155]
MIKMIRVDYRLLHGQVAFSWTQQLGADALLLVSDTLKSDPLRLEALKLAKPEGTKVVIKNTDEAIEVLNSGVTDKYKLFIICETVQIAAKITEITGVKSINIGNIAYSAEKKQVSKSVFLDHEDAELIRSMLDQGYDLFLQMVPTENKIDARSVVKGV